MRKKLTAAVLALALILGMIPGASAAELARASTQSVEVDGTPVEFQMYALVDENGGLTNYVKLRDVAHVLNSTPAKFSVGYDGTISITTGEAYTSNGSEMSTPYSGDRAYKPGPGAVKVNGADVSLDAIVLTDDNGWAPPWASRWTGPGSGACLSRPGRRRRLCRRPPRRLRWRMYRGSGTIPVGSGMLPVSIFLPGIR